MRQGLGLWICASLAACSGTSRGLEAYRNDTQQLLDGRNAQIRSCYNTALKADATLAGTVTVNFVVEEKTGTFGMAALDPAKTTAPRALGDCVLGAVQGLKLDPPDHNEGRASFVWEFKPAAS